MENRSTKTTHEELIGMLSTPGWHLVTDGKTFLVKNRTLEELVRITHTRHKHGDAPGLISRVEKAFELDSIQIQNLWTHLGLSI